MVESKNKKSGDKNPKHIAIIMDGNGRWAKAKGKPRTFGHKEGAKAVRKTVEACRDFSVTHLTLYAFSSENWKRPAEEVKTIMNLLRTYLTDELPELLKEGVKFTVIGDKTKLDQDIQDLIKTAEDKTASNEKFFLNIAINYGGRDEIVRACREIAKRVKSGFLEPEYIEENLISHVLDTSGQPDPDLVIRTSGEKRISNFLLWQMAYAEFLFMPVMWPDFDKKHLEEAINEFKKRTRRFGKV